MGMRLAQRVQPRNESDSARECSMGMRLAQRVQPGNEDSSESAAWE